ncbi:hypothetical protein cypCar_00008020, partial [Cyprinus carpio]
MVDFLNQAESTKPDLSGIDHNQWTG